MNEAQTTATLTGLVREIHETAVEHGWWECETCEGDCELDRGVRCPTCKGSGKHRNPAALIALAHSELSEALEAKRSPELDALCDKCEGSGFNGEGVAGTIHGKPTPESACRKCGGTGDALGGSRFAEELADVLIRVLDICGGLEVDIASAVVAKRKYNETRPRRHGKKF